MAYAELRECLLASVRSVEQVALPVEGSIIFRRHTVEERFVTSRADAPPHAEVVERRVQFKGAEHVRLAARVEKVSTHPREQCICPPSRAVGSAG